MSVQINPTVPFMTVPEISKGRPPKKFTIVGSRSEQMSCDPQKAVFGKVSNIASEKPLKENDLLDPTLFSNVSDLYKIESYAFKDKHKRDCHVIVPKGKEYNNFHDFIEKASKEEKLDLFKTIHTIGKNAGGFKFTIDTHPVTHKLRIYLASSKNIHFKDRRWEKTGKIYKEQPVSIENNPLFEKSKSDLETTKDASKHFVRFATPKPNHDLICPKQEYPYEDILQLTKEAPDDQKLELFDILAKNAEPGKKIYINSGTSRHIPWMHFHMRYGDKSKQ